MYVAVPRRYMYMNREILNEVRSLLERRLTVYEIAHRMCISVAIASKLIADLKK
jgi:ribosomal protein S25